jgi:Entner-Doudoroff aldolase
MAVGAGTVLDAETVARVADAGASFCVSPNVDEAVIAAAHGAGLAMVPGAATATEVARAIAAEAAIVKLFPAGPLGIDYMRALLGPFEDAAFLPTGGIAPAAAGEWIAAGAVGVGIGGSLVSARPSEADLERIVARAEAAVSAVAEARAA